MTAKSRLEALPSCSFFRGQTFHPLVSALLVSAMLWLARVNAFERSNPAFLNCGGGETSSSKHEFLSVFETPRCSDVQGLSPAPASWDEQFSWMRNRLQSASASLFTLALVFGLCFGVSSVRAAEVDTEVAGFAEFAAKGGAMEVNPACFLTSCGAQTKDCFTNSRCLKGALCLSRCRGGQDCATQCFAEYGGKKLDAWLNCTVEREKCVSVPPQLIDVKKWFETNIPKKLPDFKPETLNGQWYKVRGYNSKYDCYLCQPNSFKYSSGSSTMKADIQLRVPKLKSGGFWQNNIEENLQVLDASNRATFRAQGEIFGLSFDEEWYVLAGDDDYKLIAYKGQNLQDIYEGAFIYSRSPELSETVAAKARKAAEANSYVWSKFCVVDNSCPKLPPSTKEEDAKLEWDDIPDLIEWFAPGTIPKKEFSGAYE